MKAVGPGSGMLISGGHDHLVLVSDIDRGTSLFKISDEHVGHILSIEVITTGNYFASGGNDGRLKVYRAVYDKSRRFKHPVMTNVSLSKGF